MRLTEKQAAFVKAYVAGGEIKGAALAAGYSASYAATQAYELLSMPTIRRAIERERAGELTEGLVTREELLWTLSAIIRADAAEVLGGDLTQAQLPEEGPYTTAVERVRVQADKYGYPMLQVKMYNKLQAMRLYVRLMGWWSVGMGEPRREEGREEGQEEHEEHKGEGKGEQVSHGLTRMNTDLGREEGEEVHEGHEGERKGEQVSHGLTRMNTDEGQEGHEEHEGERKG